MLNWRWEVKYNILMNIFQISGFTSALIARLLCWRRGPGSSETARGFGCDCERELAGASLADQQAF